MGMLRQFLQHRSFATARSHFPEYFVFIAGKPIRLRDILGGMEAHHHVDIGLNELAIAQIVQIVGRVHRRLVLLPENLTYPIKLTRRWRGGTEARHRTQS